MESYIELNKLLFKNDEKTQIGENGHIEYSWSSELRESIVQFMFQLVRTSKDQLNCLSYKLYEILRLMQNSERSERSEHSDYMITLYKMIGNTRDIVSGKGERELSYMQIVVWHNFFPDLSQYALKTFVISETGEHPYGSWKDIKYFCNFCKSLGFPRNHALIQYAMSLIILQLKKDEEHGGGKSLVAKWIPRENSEKFGWIFNELSYKYFSEYLDSANTPEKLKRAENKCKMEFRKINSRLNKEINTVQINQCQGKWRHIDHTKITSMTIQKQKRAFLNITKNADVCSDKDDRIICANRFINIIRNTPSDIKSTHISIDTLVKEAVEIIQKKEKGIKSVIEEELLNNRWINKFKTDTYNEIGNVIPIIDMTLFRDSDAAYTAIGMGIHCAEKSLLGKRVLISNSDWINLEDCGNFIEMVSRVYNSKELTVNFYSAFDKIMTGIEESGITYEEAADLSIAIFSDMQIQPELFYEKESFYEAIKKKYEDLGMKLYRKKLVPPHILFWNMRSTNGFPVLSSTKNATMISGNNHALLKHFGKSGASGLSSPWISMMNILRNRRYLPLENRMKEHLRINDKIEI